MARLHQPLFENEGESIKIKIDGHFAKSFEFFGFSKIEQNDSCLKKFDGSMTFIYIKKYRSDGQPSWQLFETLDFFKRRLSELLLPALLLPLLLLLSTIFRYFGPGWLAAAAYLKSNSSNILRLFSPKCTTISISR